MPRPDGEPLTPEQTYWHVWVKIGVLAWLATVPPIVGLLWLIYQKLP